MSRMSLFSSPYMLGFDAFEERMDRLAKSADGYPPYNIERLTAQDGAERFIISIAVAGFGAGDLEVSVEDNQLQVRGRLNDTSARDFLHRGIATRQFSRAFLLADGMQVDGAQLADGLLSIALTLPQQKPVTRRINISVKA